METVLTLTKDEFFAKYKPLKNHLDKDASWDGYLYETFGEDLEYCERLSQIENKVWTVIECDDWWEEHDFQMDDWEEMENDRSEDSESACLYIVSGFHVMNRQGFFVTKKSYNQDTEVKLIL